MFRTGLPECCAFLQENIALFEDYNTNHDSPRFV